MDDEDTLPLKRVEFSLTKFNEVAIPHHLDLLRQHKANIIKVTCVVLYFYTLCLAGTARQPVPSVCVTDTTNACCTYYKHSDSN